MRRKGENMQQYISYKVNTSLEYGGGLGGGDESVSQSCVIRRFSDWVWLQGALTSELPGLLIPPLPDKALMGRFTPEFVEERRRALQLFLVRCMEHPLIRRHAHLLLFLTGTDSALGAVKARQADGSKKSAAKSLSSWWNSAVSTVTSTVSSTLGTGKEWPKSEEDLAQERMLEYSQSLQAELALLESQVEAWLAREKALGRSWFELGMSATTLAQAEGAAAGQGAATAAAAKKSEDDESGSVEYVPPMELAQQQAAAAAAAASSSSASPSSFSDAALGLGGDADLSRLLGMLGNSSDQLSNLLQKKEAEESLEFKEPLKDAQRTAQAVEVRLSTGRDRKHTRPVFLRT